MRFLHEIEERVAAVKARGDEAALARLRRRVEPILPKLAKVAKALDTFGPIFGAEVDRTLMIMPHAIRTADVDKMADALFFHGLRHAVQAASGDVASRASSGIGGERSALTKRATADTKWRGDAARIAKLIMEERARNRRQSLSDLNLAHEIRNRWAEEKDDECPVSERTLTRMIADMRNNKSLDM